MTQLREAGCAKIYREKATGARADRRELLKLLKALAPGDVVTVTRIDRLARSTFDLFAIVKQIVDAGGQFRSLAEPWADTATSTGRLMIAVLGGLADVERDLIRTRTAEGQEPGEGARAAHGPTAEAHAAAAEGSTAAAGRGRNAEGTGEELQRRQIDDFETDQCLTKKPSGAQSLRQRTRPSYAISSNCERSTVTSRRNNNSPFAGYMNKTSLES